MWKIKKYSSICFFIIFSVVMYQNVYGERTDTKQTLENGIYIVFNGETTDGQCLAIDQLDPNEEALTLVSSNQETNALWEITYWGDGYYTFKNCSSGKYLDLANGSKEDNAVVWQYNKNGTPAQLWSITPLEDDNYLITSKLSGKVLDTSQEKIFVKSASQAASQNWILKAFTPDKQLIEDGIYAVVPKNATTMAMEVRGGETELSNGASIQIWDYKNNANQAWKVQYMGNGYYTLKAIHSGMYLENHSEASPLRQYYGIPTSYSTPSTQEWKILYTQDGYYYLQSPDGNMVDLQYGRTANGSTVWSYPRNGLDAQKWLFYPADLPEEDTAVDNLEFEGPFIYYQNNTYQENEVKQILNAYLKYADQEHTTTDTFLKEIDSLKQNIKVKDWYCFIPKDVVGNCLKQNIFTPENYSLKNLTFTKDIDGDSMENTFYITDFGNGYYNVICIRQPDDFTRRYRDKHSVEIGIGFAVTKR